QAGKGRGVKGADINFAVVDEIVGAAPVEGLVRVGDEEMRGMTAGRPGQVGAVSENFIQSLAVIGGDVFHVAHILIAALDLEGADTGVDQGTQVGALIVVLHGQQVFLVGNHAALLILEGVGQAAGLGTVAPVGAAP